MDTIRQELRTFIIGNFMFGQGGDTLSNAQSFLETGVIDSTGVLELIGFLQDEFGVEVADDEMVPANLDSIAKIEAYVGRKRPAA